jgi:hypothetical protein
LIALRFREHFLYWNAQHPANTDLRDESLDVRPDRRTDDLNRYAITIGPYLR